MKWTVFAWHIDTYIYIYTYIIHIMKRKCEKERKNESTSLCVSVPDQYSVQFVRATAQFKSLKLV